MIGRAAGWDWFGHGGAFQGFISRTAMLPEASLTISLVTNAIDGPAAIWVGGVAEILRRFAREGAPARRLADWTGRWWSIWRALDLVPIEQRGHDVTVLGLVEQLAHHHPVAGEDPGTGHGIANDLKDEQPLLRADHLSRQWEALLVRLQGRDRAAPRDLPGNRHPDHLPRIHVPRRPPGPLPGVSRRFAGLLVRPGGSLAESQHPDRPRGSGLVGHPTRGLQLL